MIKQLFRTDRGLESAFLAKLTHSGLGPALSFSTSLFSSRKRKEPSVGIQPGGKAMEFAEKADRNRHENRSDI